MDSRQSTRRMLWAALLGHLVFGIGVGATCDATVRQPTIRRRARPRPAGLFHSPPPYNATVFDRRRCCWRIRMRRCMLAFRRVLGLLDGRRAICTCNIRRASAWVGAVAAPSTHRNCGLHDCCSCQLRGRLCPPRPVPGGCHQAAASVWSGKIRSCHCRSSDWRSAHRRPGLEHIHRCRVEN
jgi:hypothetical protein